MRIVYKTNKLKKTLTEDKRLFKAYGSRGKKIKQRLNQLKAAEDLWTIQQMPSLRLHPYKGNKNELWSIDIYQNWRILFSINHDSLQHDYRFRNKKSFLTTPGDTIQEHIDTIGMSQKELSYRLGRSPEKLNELINGNNPITKETAGKLEYVLGVSANFWLNLERQYQDELLEIKKLEFLQECSEWLKGFPQAALKNMGILPCTRKRDVLVEHLLKFFRVASPIEWESIYLGKEDLAFKIDLQYSTEPKAIASWLRLGEIQAEKLEIGEFNKKEITNQLNHIRNILYVKEEGWLVQLQKTCASLGIALVYTPCISKAPIYGASRWIKNKSIPLIQITDRQKDYNAFWFTFFHELAHIRYHNKSETFIDTKEKRINQDEKKEKEADDFAAKMLLSQKQRNELEKYLNFDTELILTLSRKFEARPGIIVPQLQRKGVIPYNDYELNKLKEKVEFEENLKPRTSNF